MKKLFCLISLFLALTSSAQEELFGDSNGLSFSYLRMIYEDKEPDFALGMSVLVNKSIAINAGIINIDGYSNPMAGLAYYSTDSYFLRYFIGASYARVRVAHFTYNSPEYYDILGLSFGLFRCFFPEKAFPFSVTTSISAQDLLGNNSSDNLKPQPVAGLHFKQGLFAKGQAYPFIALGLTHEFKNKITLYSAALGLNIEINSKKMVMTKDLP